MDFFNGLLGGESGLSNVTSALTADQRTQLKSAREAERIVVLFEKCELEGRLPYDWELKNQPPLPPSPEEVRAKILAAQASRLAGGVSQSGVSGDGPPSPGETEGSEPEGGGGSVEPSTGFYQVVRNGVYIVGLTNGLPLHGVCPFILEVGLDDSSSPVVGFSVASLDDDGPISGLQTMALGARLAGSWNTAQTTNGVYHLVPEVELADGTVVTGAVKVVTVQNDISFPNGYQVAGQALYIQAHTIDTNGTWHMDFYDDQNTHVGSLNGNVSSAGFCDYPGIPAPGFSLSLLDNQGSQLPSSCYSVVVTTSPAVVVGNGPAPGPGVTGPATNRVVVERIWTGNRQWAIAYQTVYPLNSSADLQLYSMMGELVGRIQEGPYGNQAVVNSPYAVTPNPFRLRFQTHWGQLYNDIANPTVRNFFYFGHGSKEFIGNADVNTSINRNFLQFLLHNSPDPLVGTNRHPYRFVFLDGCDTAKGDLCLDFGIAKQTIYATNMISRYGLQPRAFLGWKTKIGASVKNTLPQTHAKFISRFFEVWPQVNPASSYYYTLREALDAAAIDPISNQSYTTLNEDITIYGCPDLYFYD